MGVKSPRHHATKKVIRHYLILLLILLCNNALSQVFVNGAMDGPEATDITPNFWQTVPYTETYCFALTATEATVDVLGATGPNVSGGIAGIPNSDFTFCSGLLAQTGSQYLWHEGIMQNVTGFTPGEEYEIGFYQAVVKQTNCIDSSGSWQVYVDNTLVGTSVPVTSNLPPDSLNLNWVFASVIFTATSASHDIKFLPIDDDANWNTSITDENGALRMGIDDIHFVWPEPPLVDLGNDTLLCSPDSILLNAMNSGSTYEWSDGSTDSTLWVTTEGWYWVTATNQAGSDTDSIYVEFMDQPTVSLGPDQETCPFESITLSILPENNTDYLWNTGETSTQISVSIPGTYLIVATNACGTATDSMQYGHLNCQTLIQMPNVFTPNDDNVNDAFIPILHQFVENPNLIILNRWGQVIFQTNDLNAGWDGRHNNKLASEGVYFWRLEYTDTTDGSIIEMNGFLHLER